MYNQPSISDYYRNLFEKTLHSLILNESDNFIVGTPTDELVEYYFSNHALHKIELDKSRGETIEHVKEVRRVPADQRESVYRGEGDIDWEYESIVVSVAFVRDNNNVSRIRQLRTTTYSPSWNPDDCMFSLDTVSVKVNIKGYGFNLSDDQVKNEVNQAKQRINQWIGWVNDDIEKENQQLQSKLKDSIEQRKQKIKSDSDRISSLIKEIDIPLKRKESEAVTKIQLDHKPIVKKIKPTPKQQEEYKLDREKVMSILEIVDNQCRQFEKTPKTYISSNEYDLRNIILSGLNMLFEGRATGETFSNKGKTDIYLNIDKGNILVSECKIWGGGKLYQETIDQLLGYLTWRHNFGIMIAFVKNKNFSQVLNQIEDLVTAHGLYKSGFIKVEENHFQSMHSLPQDGDKEVEIHHLLYNLFVPES